jgi:tight adherence protein C
VTVGQRLARRLFGATSRAVGSYANAKIERLVAEDGALRTFEKFLTPVNEERTGRIRTKLNLAGYRSPAAVRMYFAIKWSIAIGGFVLAAALFSLTMDPTKPLLPVISVLLVVTLSFFATDMWIERQIAYRRIAVERSFPDALDLLLVCLEAGHGLDQAIARVAQELSSSAPILATELKTAVHQLRAGRDREQVLSAFAWRTGVADVKAFVTVLRQADQFGVSIAETLRVYAAEMRNKRFMRAEEKANMMPVKLALGAIMFTVPPTIIVLIGPSIIMITREMAKAAAGG